MPTTATAFPDAVVCTDVAREDATLDTSSSMILVRFLAPAGLLGLFAALGSGFRATGSGFLLIDGLRPSVARGGGLFSVGD